MASALQILFVLGLLACGGEDDADDEKKDASPVTVVNVETAGTGTVLEQLATTAVVEAERSADLVPVSPGVVLSVHADDGDPVERGDLLAVLENVSLAAGAERSRAEVGRLERQVRDTEKLFAQGAASARDLDDLRHQLANARTNAREASRSFGQTRITAPFSGVVGRREVKVGQLANGTTFQIVDLDSLRVKVDLPERDVGRIHAGQPVQLVSAYDEEVKGAGVVERVSPVIDASTGTFRVTVDVAPGQTLRPGQFVKVKLQVDRKDDVLVVPRKAVLWEDGRPHVFVMGEPDPPAPDAVPAEGEEAKPPVEGPVARRRVLQVGLVDELNVEVLSGLSVGDEVVVVGQSNLKEGARVRAATGNARVVPVPPEKEPAEGG